MNRAMIIRTAERALLVKNTAGFPLERLRAELKLSSKSGPRTRARMKGGVL